MSLCVLVGSHKISDLFSWFFIEVSCSLSQSQYFSPLQSYTSSPYWAPPYYNWNAIQRSASETVSSVLLGFFYLLVSWVTLCCWIREQIVIKADDSGSWSAWEIYWYGEVIIIKFKVWEKFVLHKIDIMVTCPEAVTRSLKVSWGSVWSNFICKCRHILILDLRWGCCLQSQAAFYVLGNLASAIGQKLHVLTLSDYRPTRLIHLPVLQEN